VNATDRAQFFRCPRYHCKLTRARCAELYRDAEVSRRRSEGFAAAACKGCSIGADHARGKLAQVELATVERVDAGPPPPVRCICGQPLPPGRRKYCGSACANDEAAEYTGRIRGGFKFGRYAPHEDTRALLHKDWEA